jgi:hypothetical protein
MISAGRGPARSGEVRLRGSGQDEPSWAGIVIDRPLDGTENVGDQLPLVDQDWLVKVAERGIRVGPDDGGLGRDVQAESRTAQAASRGRLAAGPGPHDQDGGVGGQHLAQLQIQEARDVGAHLAL